MRAKRILSLYFSNGFSTFRFTNYDMRRVIKALSRLRGALRTGRVNDSERHGTEADTQKRRVKGKVFQSIAIVQRKRESDVRVLCTCNTSLHFAFWIHRTYG